MTNRRELEDIVNAVLGRVAIAAVLVLAMLGTLAPSASAVPITNDAFTRTWQRTDKPVADFAVSRTWMWGPEPFTAAGPEEYTEAPSGIREVQYFDKSRMEINHDPNVPADSPWKVTNGLLVTELMTGQIQVGDSAYKTREPARVNVAGDTDDTSNVTYWFMGLLQDEEPFGVGNVITQFLSPGSAGRLYVTVPEMANYGVGTAVHIPETNHTIATPFWDFMNSWGTVYEDGAYVEAPLFENPFYATGYPLTEAYWARVKVAGAVQPVLIQCFERRCLTYTPNNDPAWRVEAGNVGQHYFKWRYGSGDAPPDEPAPVYDHIPSLDTDTALMHLNAIGDCGEPNRTSAGWVTMYCVPHAYPQAAYSVLMSTWEYDEVVAIYVNVSDPSSNPSPQISEIGAFVLGWVAQIPYLGAYPSHASATVIANIDRSGHFDVSGIRFEVNPPESMEPSWSDTGFWGNTRMLHIAPIGRES